MVTFCVPDDDPTVVPANVRLVGVAVSVAEVGAVPVPVRATVSDGLLALLATVSEPVRVPVAVGLNETLAVHDAPAARVAPQVVVSAKSPPIVTPETLADAP